MKREKLFDDVRAAHANVDRVESIVVAYSKTGSTTKGGHNTMYNSKGAGGSISNDTVLVCTSTLEIKLSNGSKTLCDVVSVMVDDGTCEEPKEAFLTKEECMELIRHLATAATLLRD